MSGAIWAEDVEPEPVSFLWRERIPRGMISIVAGQPDKGKGLVSVLIAADVTRAGGKVLYSAAEDSNSLMTAPRLIAAGADLSKILLYRFALPNNQEEVSDLIKDESFDLVIMDPWAAHLGRGVNRHSDKIREVLNPLTKLIESTGTAVLIVEHALKRPPKDGDILGVIGGSGSGLPAASRTAYVFGIDPEDDEARIMAPAKFNIGPRPKALHFELDTTEVEGIGEVPYLSVDDELLAFDPMRLFTSRVQPGKVGRPADKRAAACEWLTSYLINAGGPVPGSKIVEDAKQAGMTVKTLRRAAEDMEIVKHPASGPKVTWDLPDSVKDALGLSTPTTADTEVVSDESEVGDVDELLAGIFADTGFEFDEPESLEMWR